jgi:hypothetical protein
MRRIRGIVTIVVMSASMVGAHAGFTAPAPSSPFSADESIFDNCGEGAECAGEAMADGDGNQTASSSITRSVLAPNTITEFSVADADGTVRERLPSGASAVRVTYKWRVDSASTAANSTALDGAAVGRVFARGIVSGCKGCLIEDSTNGHGTRVASTYSRFGQLTLQEPVAQPGSEVTHEITLRGANGRALPRSPIALTGRTRAFSYVGEVCSGTCQPSSGHSGSASASADLQLLSITVERV